MKKQPNVIFDTKNEKTLINALELQRLEMVGYLTFSPI